MKADILLFLRCLLLIYSGFLVACSGGDSSSSSQSDVVPIPTVVPVQDLSHLEYLSGGDASTSRSDENAFSQSPQTITTNFEQDANFKQGNFLFRGRHANEGPLLNNSTCQGCHIKDGRGNPPVLDNEPLTSMLFKLNLGRDVQGAPIPDPIFGFQLQTFGVDLAGQHVPAGYEAALDGVTVTGEAHATIDYIEEQGTYEDGEPYSLRKPVYKIIAPAYGDFSDGLLLSPRVAPGMIGLGLLEAIPQASIIALADENDTDGDGISGRVKWIKNSTTGNREIGRFGWKSSTGSVLQQTANAFRGDMGITNRFATNENCSDLQAACLDRATQEEAQGETLDLSDLALAFVEFYSRLLAVPQRRGYDRQTEQWQSDIQAGRELFNNSLGCAGCHTPYHLTGTAQESVLGSIENLGELHIENNSIDVLSQQHIWPYTDMLLHDMGGQCTEVKREDDFGNSCDSGANCAWVLRCEGLADGQFDGDASGVEWRTAPLWGLGLVQVVNPKAGFLHDGRARTIEEAILWHGGEASLSQQAFKALDEEQRLHLLAFLQSL